MTKDQIIKQLQEENKRLKDKLEKELDKSLIKNEMVFQQSRFAMMGEMIGNIAHQWRQPLMEMSTLMMKEEAKIKLLDQTSKGDILDMINKSTYILKFMSQTIDDFKNFFATNKEKEEFSITSQISTALQMTNSTLKEHNIKINVVIKSNTKITGFANEYTQVLINIIMNAKDAIISKDIKNGKINIKLYKNKQNGKSILEIDDNGGGIECSPIEKVFEPFFTYQKKNGTGIGLFMSKLIIENNMNGKLEVVNNKRGASFRITA